MSRRSTRLENSQDERRNIQRRELRLLNPIIRDYFEENKYVIENEGYIDEVKMNGNIRILAMNIYGCKLSNRVKLDMIKTSLEKYQIDIALFNETNTKWNTVNINRIERELKKMDKEVQIIMANSKE